MSTSLVASIETEKKRFLYIDCVKALTIIGVVNVHSHIPPSWLTGLLVNGIFFFLAGMFFKKPNQENLVCGYRDMLVKDSRTLLLSFVFFYTLSYPFRIIVHMWDYRTLTGFDWWCYFDFLDICARRDYLFVNVPFWFILCLFIVKCIYYWVRCLPEMLIFLIALLALYYEDVLTSIATPFMLNDALYWIGFFALGNLFAGNVSPQKMPIRRRVVISCVAIGVLMTSIGLEGVVTEEVLKYIRFFSVLMALLFAFSLLEKKSCLGPCSFIGRNTLIILGCHVWFLIPLGRISYMITRNQTVWTGLIDTIICMIFSSLFILLSNKYFPALVGKLSSKSK